MVVDNTQSGRIYCLQYIFQMIKIVIASCEFVKILYSGDSSINNFMFIEFINLLFLFLLSMSPDVKFKMRAKNCD